MEEDKKKLIERLKDSTEETALNVVRHPGSTALSISLLLLQLLMSSTGFSKAKMKRTHFPFGEFKVGAIGKTYFEPATKIFRFRDQDLNTVDVPAEKLRITLRDLDPKDAGNPIVSFKPGRFEGTKFYPTYVKIPETMFDGYAQVEFKGPRGYGKRYFVGKPSKEACSREDKCDDESKPLKPKIEKKDRPPYMGKNSEPKKKTKDKKKKKEKKPQAVKQKEDGFNLRLRDALNDSEILIRANPAYADSIGLVADLKPGLYVITLDHPGEELKSVRVNDLDGKTRDINIGLKGAEDAAYIMFEHGLYNVFVNLINRFGTKEYESLEIKVLEPVCVPDWDCNSWNACLPKGYQTRECDDKNNCKDEAKKPETSRICLPPEKPEFVGSIHYGKGELPEKPKKKEPVEKGREWYERVRPSAEVVVSQNSVSSSTADGDVEFEGPEVSVVAGAGVELSDEVTVTVYGEGNFSGDMKGKTGKGNVNGYEVGFGVGLNSGTGEGVFGDSRLSLLIGHTGRDMKLSLGGLGKATEEHSGVRFNLDLEAPQLLYDGESFDVGMSASADVEVDDIEQHFDGRTFNYGAEANSDFSFRFTTGSNLGDVELSGGMGLGIVSEYDLTLKPLSYSGQKKLEEALMGPNGKVDMSNITMGNVEGFYIPVNLRADKGGWYLELEGRIPTGSDLDKSGAAIVLGNKYFGVGYEFENTEFNGGVDRNEQRHNFILRLSTDMFNDFILGKGKSYSNR